MYAAFCKPSPLSAGGNESISVIVLTINKGVNMIILLSFTSQYLCAKVQECFGKVDTENQGYSHELKLKQLKENSLLEIKLTGKKDTKITLICTYYFNISD